MSNKPLTKSEIERRSAELLKEAGFLGDAADWVREHPGLTVGGAGLLGAGGVLARRFLGRAAPVRGDLQARLRRIAEKEGLSVATPVTRGSAEVPITRLEKLKARLRTLGAKPQYTDQYGNPLTEAGKFKDKVKGVTVGVDPGVSASKGEIAFGGLRGDTKKMETMLERASEIDRKGKVFEQSKAIGLEHLFPKGTSIGQIRKKYGIKPLKRGASVKEKRKHLDELQKAFKKEYGKQGFVAKPHGEVASSGAFPTEKGKWSKLHKDYEERLAPQIEALRKDIRANPQKYDIGKSEMNIIAERFRSDPAYAGGAFTGLLRQPNKALIQQKENLVRGFRGKPHEYRIHMIGGEVPRELAYGRYTPVRTALERIPGMSKVLSKTRGGSAAEAAKWVEQTVSPQMRKKYRGGTYALDVMRVKKPGGGYDYKLVELNPSTGGGWSGFLDPTINPMVGQDVTKWVTGRDAPIVTALKTMGAGGAASGAAAAGVSALGPKKGPKPQPTAQQPKLPTPPAVSLPSSK